MQVSKDFVLQEFVPKEVYDALGDKAVWMVDPKVIAVVQYMRDTLNCPITINTWHIGGTQNYCGFRPRKCDVGAEYSQHRCGRAADPHVSGWDYDKLRQWVRDHFVELNKLGLTTIELGTPTWLHFDVRPTGLDHLLEVPFQ